MIGIIDYGMGNLRSVQKALQRLGADAEFISDARDLSRYPGLILPGVGAFRDAIAELRRQDFVAPLQTAVAAGTPLLGICLGMQLLFDRSYEDGEHQGLGIVAGDVVRFEPEPGLKIPHMGWNALQFEKTDPLFEGAHSGDYVYFVHSYHVRPENEEVIAARTQHGNQTFVSVIHQDNVFATQFHPEKSQRVGLSLLKNFIGLVPFAAGC